MDNIFEKYSITSEKGRALLLRRLLYDCGVRFMLKVTGETHLCMEKPPSTSNYYDEVEELRDLDNVCLAEKDGELFVIRRKTS